mgnify:CR=1 FL=1
MDKYDVIVIGGGASGMMAAIAASESNCVNTEGVVNYKRVLIIEHNDELGKKLKITGGGRCNILNCEYDKHALLSNYGKASSALQTSFSKFGVLETINFFKDLGIEIKVEDRKRAFPISEKALDVYNALEKKLYTNGVEVLFNNKAIKFDIEDSGSVNKDAKNKLIKSIQCIGLKDQSQKTAKKIYADKFILATGGMSHPETGSTGDGFKILHDIGVNINTPTQGLVPVRSETRWVNELSGKTLKNVKMTILVDNIKKLTLNNKTKGNKHASIDKNINILCTHFGISGPSIINVSSDIRKLLIEGSVTAKIDLFKDLDHKQLNQIILDVFNKNKNKKIKNILNEIYPDNILATFLSEFQNLFSNDFLNIEVNSVSREDRWELVHLLKDLPLTIDGLMDNTMAIITDGGVDLKDVDMNTFKIKAIENLHVTGDLLDISRPSGGYSLQLCWTTGYIAGSTIVSK